MIRLTLNDPWFELVKSGKKLYEGRAWKGNTCYLKPGDTIEFYHHIDQTVLPFTKKIKNIHRFDTFRTALEQTGIEKVLPEILSIEEGVEIYLKYVSIQTQNQYGVCLIEF
jgi:ASC-1-like (ASCH) protein